MNPDAQTRRLFVGTFLSPEQQESLGRLAERKTDLEKHLQCRVRFVKPLKLHLTWLFLGDVDMGKVPEVQIKLQEISRQWRQQSLNYDQVQLWPSDKRARMIVLAPEVVPEVVQETAAAIGHDLKPYVSKSGHRDYRPHVTLARLERENLNARTIEIPNWLAEECSLPVVHKIDCIELIQSELGTNSDQYQSIQHFDLA